jgi:hypothetical protein
MPGAPNWSSGRHVFDTAHGFSGVWHLREDAADTTADRLYLDATAGGGQGDDRVAAATTDGVIGAGQVFNAGDYVRVRGTPLLKPDRQFTVSAWVKSTVLDSNGGDIDTLGQSYGIRLDPGGLPTVLISQTDLTSTHLSANAINALDSAWHQITGWFDGSSLAVYFDGVQAAKSLRPGPVNYNHGPDLLLGRHGDEGVGFNFTGAMDEVQFSRVPRSPDWIKLSFENQRLNATLVEFR